MRQWISRINVRRAIPRLFAVAALLFFAYQVTAQEGTILGTVSDPSGAVVANASVNIVNLETGLSSVVVSDGAGQYVAPDLRIGHYTIKVAASGFKAVEKTGVMLQVGDRLRLDFALQVGAQTQTVTVEADALHLQTDTGEVSNMITATDIEKLEMNGRSLVSMEAMVPGAVSLQGSAQVPSSQGSDAAVEFNGQRTSHNMWLMDGGEAADRGGGGAPIVSPSLEAVAEARTMTSNYSPEYGLSSGGTITTTFKTGTRQFHGEGWEFFRNDYLDARNYFNPAPARPGELRYNIFGANIGGPVSFHPNKSEPKTFFFYNQEWRRFVNASGVINQQVPITSAYQGNFSGVTDSKGNAIVPTTPCAFQINSTMQAAFTAASVPLSTSTTSGGVTTCNGDKTFPGNAIPSSLLDKDAQVLLTEGKIFPAPNKGVYFNLPVAEPNDITEELVRVDHKFSDKFSVFGHWVSEQTTQGYATVMWSGDNVPTVGNTFGNPAYSAVIHTTYTINPNLVNEAYFNYDSNQIHILPFAAYGAKLAAPSDYTYNRVFTGPIPGNVMPSIALQKQSGTNYSPNWSPWNNVASDYSVHDDVSWVRGAHQFKFGGSWAFFSKVQDAFAPVEGNFGFNGYYTNYDFADFLLGLAQNYNESAVHQAGTWNNISPALYFLDNWRATPRLTVNLGLRWDGIPHTYEANHRSSDFYPNLYNAANAAKFDNAGNLCSGASDPGCTAITPGLVSGTGSILGSTLFYTNGIGIGGVTPGIPKGLADNQWNGWGPRLGFSYDLTGQGRTVVRGGFGVMYERIQGNDMYDGATNVPANASVNFNNVLLKSPKTSAATGTTLTAPIVVASIQGIEADDYKLPSTTQYSAGIQHQLNAGTIFDVSYVGTLLRHQSDDRDINLPPISALPGLIASSSNYNQLLPYPGFAGIKQFTNEANGEYNSIQADVHLNIHQDLQAQFGYTYSHAYDTSQSSGNGFDLDNVSNPYSGWKFDWGPSVFDRHQVAFLEYEWSMPFFRHSTDLASKLLGGWELAGSSVFEGGAPLNVTLGGNQGSNGLQNGTNRPNLIGSVYYPKQRSSAGMQWFSPGFGVNNPTFGTPTPGLWGNLPYNALRGPGSQNWNIAMHKIFRFTEHSNFELRAETFNIFNHPQWVANGNQGGIGTNLNGGNFGLSNGSADPREFQLAGKINF
ncbi:MAG: carboxypeptidase regulatory-like domain-containing protein [Terracidiphilus sp.]